MRKQIQPYVTIVDENCNELTYYRDTDSVPRVGDTFFFAGKKFVVTDCEWCVLTYALEHGNHPRVRIFVKPYVAPEEAAQMSNDEAKAFEAGARAMKVQVSSRIAQEVERFNDLRDKAIAEAENETIANGYSWCISGVRGVQVRLAELGLPTPKEPTMDDRINAKNVLLTVDTKGKVHVSVDGVCVLRIGHVESLVLNQLDVTMQRRDFTHIDNVQSQ